MTPLGGVGQSPRVLKLFFTDSEQLLLIVACHAVEDQYRGFNGGVNNNTLNWAKRKNGNEPIV